MSYKSKAGASWLLFFVLQAKNRQENLDGRKYSEIKK